MTVLIATSVVRGSHQGESHGGVYLIDVESDRVVRTVDWDRSNIDWQGRGWDRGLRGIAFDGERIFIAASDELFVYSPEFELQASYRCPYLKHCHEITVYERSLFLTSTGFDSILGFDLDACRFSWGLCISHTHSDFRGKPFNPESGSGPSAANTLHINNVYCSERGMYISGLKTGAVLHYNGKTLLPWASQPRGSHNARPFRDGVLFNDTESDVVRYVTADRQCGFHVPRFEPSQLSHTELDDSLTARQSFARGLAVLNDSVIAAGSSPSTVALHDLDSMKTFKIITLTMDIRNAIHGLEVWPYDSIPAAAGQG